MKLIQLVFLFSFFSFNLFSQVHWTKYENNPVMVPGASGEWDENSVGPGTVLFYDNTYHMYYDGSGPRPYGIGHATSTDGIIWTRDLNNPILELGAAGEWDDYFISDPFVVKADTIFHMWYGAEFGTESGIYRTGHATSPDGINWTKDPDNPVKDIAEYFDATEYCVHSSVMHDGSLYHMYFSKGRWSSNRMDICHATSSDGWNWTIDPQNPVMEGFKWNCATNVIFDGDRYFMWFCSGDSWEWAINIAFSDDGSTWEKYGNNPVISKGPSGSWDGLCAGRNVVLFDSTEFKYKTWYTGTNRSGYEIIGYAVSDTCSDYILPVIHCDSSEFYQPEYIEVMSTEDGVIYLVPFPTKQDLNEIFEKSIVSVEVNANTTYQMELPEPSPPNGLYYLYAIDKANNISNQHSITVTGVGVNDKYAKLSAFIYPNPADNIINVQSPFAGPSSIVISTIKGQEIYNDSFHETSHQIDLSSFQKGVYFITIRSKDFVTTEKIIKL